MNDTILPVDVDATPEEVKLAQEAAASEVEGTPTEEEATEEAAAE